MKRSPEPMMDASEVRKSLCILEICASFSTRVGDRMKSRFDSFPFYNE